MKCPNCYTDQDHHVIQTRKAGETVKRRRECRYCGYRFTTYERVLTQESVKDKG